MQSLGIVIRIFLRGIVGLESLFTAVPSQSDDVSSYIRVKMTLVVPVAAIDMLNSLLSIDVIIIAAVVVR